MNLTELENKVKRSRYFAISIGAIVIGAYSLSFFGANISSRTESWGQFGDYVGGLLNPIIAFLAFYWLTQSVLLQKEELADTKRALQESAQAQTKQEKHAEKTAKINAYNALLTMYNTDVSNIRSNLDFVNSQLNELRSNRPGYSPVGKKINFQEAQELIDEMNNGLETTLNKRMEISNNITQLLNENT